MKKNKRILTMIFLTALLLCLSCQTVFAFSESDAQAQVDAAGKAAVSGNVLVWFLCAIAFLKVSQKIDSFMSSLGVNVGHTGGSMIADAMIAARGIGAARNFSRQHFRGAHSNNSSHVNHTSNHQGSSSGFMAGGLAGVVSRQVTNSAIQTATSHTESHSKREGGRTRGFAAAVSEGIGGHMYTTSVVKGGDFANGVIGTVATGNIAFAGSITGEKAVQALHSYMGYAALEEGTGHVPSFTNVEIGGGRITGTEISEEHSEGISFGMYHTAQYTAPEGAYATVQAVDGTSWYKQYAQDAVEKSPYMAADGSIAYNETIVKKLPPAPKRKDRI
ncbi:hypothetical protein [Enterocloster clostridioformis]|uniref:Uncharacterized protein n=1 Tax=Enterocloster clostridioformis TaxID=1531 RepID=A0A2X2TWG6_9FIRM|nr:hypothetical protein [Enterocloster clostridioformis]MCA5577234.1 hypothetical protein [Enterocloster clostridioformis]SQB10192.1 Uncharacterised protein [Enterocloster clostridioformis]